MGRVSLPLVVSGGSYAYRLGNAYVAIWGPQSAQLSSSGDPNETELATTLQTGAYTAYLGWWTLERDDGSGTFRAIPARLISSNAVAFQIFNGTTSTVTYQFQTDGVIVTMGAGALKVKATVDEIPAVCTPFGSDCYQGTWCPPTGITGAQRACIVAGSAAIGDPCSSPVECVANASCFDTGTALGSVCLELCPDTSFDLACVSGGTCRRAEADYGVCRPSPVETAAP
jgi:hypothetical protein